MINNERPIFPSLNTHNVSQSVV